MKCCQHLPESVAENKERSRADGKRQSLNKDSQFAQCRNWREQSHDCQVVYQNLSVELKLIILKESSTARKYHRPPLVSAL